MTFLQRNALIQELYNRGFQDAESSDGWLFKHPEDGFKIWFNAGGRYRLTVPGKATQFGVATEPVQVLEHIDREAAAL